jgi:antitoxin YefM
MTTCMTATDARKNFYTVMKMAARPGGAVTLTHDGLPKVVMMSYEDFEGWMETFDIQSDPEEVAAIEEGLEQLKRGEVVDFDMVKKRHKL